MGFLTTKGTQLPRQNILWTFYKLSLPHKADFLHCKGYQKDNMFISISHNLADTTAKQAPQQMLSPRPFYQFILVTHKKG
jgi:hypothetical protein